MRETVEILGVKIDKITMQQALDKVKAFLEEDRVHLICTPNAEFIMDAQRNKEFKDILSRSDMNTADGAGILLASKILSLGLPEKVSGVDLCRNIFANATPEKRLRCYFFGGTPGVAETAAQNITAKYPNVDIAGCRNGYFKPEETAGIVEQISSAKPDVLLVALGKVRQEKFIYDNRDALCAKVCVGVGGTLDIFAGKVKLAPDFFRRHGLEWLYRLYREPSRFIRMLDLPRFVLRVVRYKITGK